MDEKYWIKLTQDNTKEIRKNEKEVSELKRQLAIVAERVTTIFKRIENMEDSLKWVNRLILGGLAGGIGSLFFAVIKWAFTN